MGTKREVKKACRSVPSKLRHAGDATSNRERERERERERREREKRERREREKREKEREQPSLAGPSSTLPRITLRFS